MFRAELHHDASAYTSYGLKSAPSSLIGSTRVDVNGEDLLDAGCNADLYVANQESTDSIREEHVVDALFAFNNLISEY